MRVLQCRVVAIVRATGRAGHVERGAGFSVAMRRAVSAPISVGSPCVAKAKNQGQMCAPAMSARLLGERPCWVEKIAADIGVAAAMPDAGRRLLV